MKYYIPLVIIIVLCIGGLIYFNPKPETIIETETVYVIYEGPAPYGELPVENYVKELYNLSLSIESNSIVDCKGEDVGIKRTNGMAYGLLIGEDRHNITIKNCVINIHEDFKEANWGIVVYSPQNLTSDIRLINNTINITGGFRTRGIQIQGGHDMLISDNNLYIIGDRTYGIRTQEDNSNIDIVNNFIEIGIIEGGTFVTGIETSNWVGKYAYNLLVENNTIYCHGKDEEQYAYYVGDTRWSRVANNYAILDKCSILYVLKSTNVEIWNNVEVKDD